MISLIRFKMEILMFINVAAAAAKSQPCDHRLSLLICAYSAP